MTKTKKYNTKKQKKVRDDATLPILAVVLFMFVLFMGAFLFYKVNKLTSEQELKIARKSTQEVFVPKQIEPPPQAYLACENVPYTPFSDSGNEALFQDLTTRLFLATENLQNERRQFGNFLSQEQKRRIFELAKARKQLLLSAMRQNPQASTALVLDSIKYGSLISELQQFTKGCVETPINYSGTLVVRHYHDMKNDSSHYKYEIKNKSGENFIFYPEAVNTKDLISGIRIEGNGVLINGNELVGTTDFKKGNPLKIQADQGPPAIGNKKMLVLMIYFKDQRKPSLSKDVVNTEIENVKNFYRENSYEKLALQSDIYGWYQLGINTVCGEDSIDAEALRVFNQTNPTIDLRQYDFLYYFISYKGLTGCSNGGGGTLGKVKVNSPQGELNVGTGWTETEYAGSFYVTAHELGHMLGHSHANSADCGTTPLKENIDGCNQKEYGNYYSVMGRSSSVRHDTSPYKEQSFWTTSETLPMITQSGRYTLTPIESNSGGLKGIKLPRSNINKSGSQYLYLEYRQPIGYDTGTNSMDVFQGLSLNATTGPHSYLIDATSPPFDVTSPTLRLNQIFTDPASGATIKPVAISPSEVTIDIQTGKQNFVPPTISIRYPINNSILSSKTLINVDVTDDQNEIKYVAYYLRSLTGNEQHPTLIHIQTEAPYDYWLPIDNLENDQYELFVSASDRAGDPYGISNNIADSRPITFQVNKIDYAAPQITFQKINQMNANNPIRVAAQVTDQSGEIDRVEFYLDRQTAPFYVDYEQPYDLTAPFLAGEHTITLKAYDGKGNMSTQSTRIMVANNPSDDTIKPRVTFLSPIKGSVLSKSVTIEVLPTDNLELIQNVELYIDKGSTPIATLRQLPYRISFDTLNFSNSVHSLEAVSVDTFGNRSEKQILPIIIDNREPDIDLGFPSYNYARVSGSAAEFYVYVEDDDRVEKIELYINGKLVQIIRSQISMHQSTWNSTSVKNGIYNLSYKAYDRAGNSTVSPNVKIIVVN